MLKLIPSTLGIKIPLTIINVDIDIALTNSLTPILLLFNNSYVAKIYIIIDIILASYPKFPTKLKFNPLII